jgi:hypothetical protein
MHRLILFGSGDGSPLIIASRYLYQNETMQAKSGDKWSGYKKPPGIE